MLRSLPIHHDNPSFLLGKSQSKRGISAPTETSRLLKHWSTLRDLAAKPNTEAVVVLAHLSNAVKFDPASQRGGPASENISKAHQKVMDLGAQTASAGVKFFQVNFVFGEPDAGGMVPIRLGNVWELNL